MPPKTNKEKQSELVARDRVTATAAHLVDHRGNAITSGRRLLTFLNRLHEEHGEQWPEGLYREWVAQRKLRGEDVE